MGYSGENRKNLDSIEKGEVAKIFKDSIFLERELESAKIELSLKPDFNLLDLFRMLDPYAKGFFTPQDLIENLQRNLQIDTATPDDALLFFRRYDLNLNGKLTFTEFCKSVTPISKEYAQLITGRPDFFSRKQSIHISEYFNPDTRAEIRNLLRVMLHTERANECLRTRIAKRPYFSVDAAFQYLDRNRDGIVTANEVRDMLADHGFFATEKEMQLIMNKFDKDRDMKIGEIEFNEEMEPRLRVL